MPLGYHAPRLPCPLVAVPLATIPLGYHALLNSTLVCKLWPHQDMPTAMSLLSESADVNAKAMAQRLAKRTKQQWFVSCSLPANGERL